MGKQKKRAGGTTSYLPFRRAAFAALIRARSIRARGCGNGWSFNAMSRQIKIHRKKILSTLAIIFYLSIPTLLLADEQKADTYIEQIEKLYIEMTPIPGGWFEMGYGVPVHNVYDVNIFMTAVAQTYMPSHKIYLDSFWIGKYEITVGHWKIFLADTNKKFDLKKIHKYSPGDNFPIGNVSWFDAVEFTEWLTKKSGKIYRLPTEAEWEHAAKGGLGYLYATKGGMLNGSTANCYTFGRQQQYKYSTPIGFFPPNPFGVCDMTGNVSEWCLDWYDGSYYKVSPENNPQGPTRGKQRSIRGFSWKEIYVDNVFTFYRSSGSPQSSHPSRGFRIISIEKN